MKCTVLCIRITLTADITSLSSTSQSVDLKKVRHDNIRICDFGLVNMVRKPESTKKIVRKGYACGTPGFFAPEMIIKKEFEGGTADMWSLGAILLEITLGFTKEWLQSYEKAETDPIAFQKGLEDCLNEIPRTQGPRSRLEHPSSA